MLPPVFKSMIGYSVRSNKSPVLTTSDLRKKTMLLPSVFAGRCMMITASSLK